MPVFLFTDIENSTRLWEQHKQIMGDVLARHDAILREELQKAGGKIIKHRGDGIFAVFENGNPLECAVNIQKRMDLAHWGAIKELRIRMALHAGEAERRGEDYFGPTINRTARILDTGWGGQILVTPEVLKACPLPPGATPQDLGMHLLKDLSEPQMVYALLHPDLKQREFPPLRSLSSRPHNIPPQPTPFIGREDELQKTSDLFENPQVRQVTILGPGGIGKTRLAIQWAAEHVDHFSHGAYFVPLAQVSSGEFVIPALAQALKISFYGSEEPKSQLLNYLREKEMLLVLDNSEHLTEVASLVSEILQTAPQVKILVTSRERLNIRGEWVLELQGLSVPLSDWRNLESYSSIQLFIQAARRASPGFTLLEEDKPYLIYICQIVHGMPLGIELAASWARVLSTREIAQEIEKNFDFLATTLRDVPERHRSLRAVFQYSWVLISDEERTIFKKLSIFRGGFVREAAQKVAQASLPVLSSLVDKSLLRRNPAGRYDIHELLRQYGEEKLDESPDEAGKTHDLHARFYTDFLSRLEHELKGGKQVEALREIGEEIENIRMAWEVMVAEESGEMMEKSLEGLYLFYLMRSWLREGDKMFAKAGEGGRILARRALFCRLLSEHEVAKELLEKNLVAFQNLNNKREIAFCLNTLGTIAFDLDKYDEARDLFRESLMLYTELGDLQGRAKCLNDLGDTTFEMGDYAQAKSFLQEAIPIRKKTGDRFGLARGLDTLGLILCILGEFAESKGYLEEALAIGEEIGDQRRIALSLHYLGHLAYVQGLHEEAESLLEKSLRASREITYPIGIGLAFQDLGNTALAQGKHDVAEMRFQEGLALNEKTGNRWGVAGCLSGLGRLSLQLKRIPEAQRHLHEGLKIALEMRSAPVILDLMLGLALLCEQTEQGQKALELVSYVLGHPATDVEIRFKAQELLGRLGPASPGPVNAGSLEEIAKNLLEETREAV